MTRYDGTRASDSRNRRTSTTRRRRRSRDDDDDDDDDEVIDENANHTTGRCLQYRIRFSRIFQRHVVHRIRDDGNDDDDDDDDIVVLRSYRFLDEAISSYPDATIMAPYDATRPSCPCDMAVDADDDPGGDDGVDDTDDDRGVAIANGERYRRGGGGRGRGGESSWSYSSSRETRSIAGMGLRTMCDMEYDSRTMANDDDVDDRDDDDRDDDIDGRLGRRRHSNDALRTLLDLAFASDDAAIPRHFYRLDVSRIEDAGHTSSTIIGNHGRILNLLGRFRDDDGDYSRPYRGGTGGGGGGGGITTTKTTTTTIATTADGKLDATTTTNDDEDDYDDDGKVPVVGLAMDDADVSFVIRNFPYLSLYDIAEVEGLIRFLLDPLPDPGEYPSVSMVADGRMCGDDVDCEWCAGEFFLFGAFNLK